MHRGDYGRGNIVEGRECIRNFMVLKKNNKIKCIPNFNKGKHERIIRKNNNNNNKKNIKTSSYQLL